MPQYTYDIVLSTPLGQRRGTMTMSIGGQKIEGVFDIMRNRNPFWGQMGENGDFRIQGRLITLVRTIEYTACGHLDRETVELTLQEKRGRLHVSGTASGEEK